MWLVDTSVWIDHFRREGSDLSKRLSEGLVIMHPSISGELACGNFENRSEVLFALRQLPSATPAADAEVLHLIEDSKLWDRGIGWLDAHLLASALLSRCRFWTLDERLAQAAESLGLLW